MFAIDMIPTMHPAYVLRHRRTCGIFNPNANPRSLRLLRIFKYLAVPGSLVSTCCYRSVTAEPDKSIRLCTKVSWQLFATVSHTVVGVQIRWSTSYWRHDLGGLISAKFPKLFLRLRTESQTSDFPMTLAKWFYEKLVIDSKRLAFYHHY